MDKITVVLHWSKETKNKHRYEAVSQENSQIDCVYLRKADTGSTPPKQVRVTVEVA